MIRIVSTLVAFATLFGVIGLSSAKAKAKNPLRRVQVALKVQGHVLHKVKGKEKRTPIRVDGMLGYDERLTGSGDKLAAVRYYDKSLAKINIDGNAVEPKLRDDRRLIVVQPQTKGALLFSPKGTLRREELDIIDVQGNTLFVDQLLASHGLSIGSTWKPKDEVLAALLSLDKLTSNSVECKFEKVESGSAHIAIAGNIGGSIDGSLTELSLTGSMGIDKTNRQVQWLVLDLNESRMAGPAGPALKVSGNLRVTLKPIATSERLSNASLAGVSLKATNPLVLLRLDATANNYRCWHDRRWHMIDQRERTTVLRMIDDGQRIAQCNITVAEPPKDKSSMTLAQFKAEVEKSLNKFDAKLTSAKEHAGRTAHRVIGVTCEGTVSGVPIAWHYFHVVNSKTLRRATIVVTLEADRADDLDRTDLMIARSMQLLDVKPTVAKKPAGTTTQ